MSALAYPLGAETPDGSPEGSPSDEEERGAAKGKNGAQVLQKRHLFRLVQGCLKAWGNVGDKVNGKVKSQVPKRLASSPPRTKTGNQACDAVIEELFAEVEELRRLTQSDKDRRTSVQSVLREVLAEPPVDGDAVQPELAAVVQQWVARTIPTSIAGKAPGVEIAASVQERIEASSETGCRKLQVDELQGQVEMVLQSGVKPAFEEVLAEECRLLFTSDRVLLAAVDAAMMSAAKGWQSNDGQAISRMLAAARHLAGPNSEGLQDALSAVASEFAQVKGNIDSSSIAAAAAVGTGADPKKALIQKLQVAVSPLLSDVSSLREQTLATKDLFNSLEAPSEHRKGNASEPGARGKTMGESIAQKRQRIQKLCAEGAFQLAFELALEVESAVVAGGGSSELGASAVELACEEVMLGWGLSLGDGSNTTHSACAEALLSQEPKPLTSALMLQLILAMLKGSLRSSMSMQRLHINLDWVLAFVGALEPLGVSGSAQGQEVEDAASLLQRGAEPPVLAAASAEEQRQVSKKARMVSKQLALLCSS